MRRPGTRLILGGIAALSILGASALAIGGLDAPGPIKGRPASERPRLMLVTTLPILFPEEFKLEGTGSRALTALESRYAVVPIGTTDPAALDHRAQEGRNGDATLRVHRIQRAALKQML